MAKLEEKDLKEWAKLTAEAGAAEEKISKRVREVLDLVFKAHGWDGKKNYWFWYPGVEWEHEGNPDFENDPIQIATDCSGVGIPQLVWSTTLCDGLPQRFLFMKDEEIEAEILEEIKDDLEKELKKKQAAQNHKKKKEALKKQAAEKLTPEERAALGLK